MYLKTAEAFPIYPSCGDKFTLSCEGLERPFALRSCVITQEGSWGSGWKEGAYPRADPAGFTSLEGRGAGMVRQSLKHHLTALPSPNTCFLNPFLAFSFSPLLSCEVKLTG